MDWSDEFFAHRRLTSKLKHLVLRRYVKEFAYHLGKSNPTVFYVDGFAGAGVYPGPPQEDGSPLLIARLAKQLRAGPKPIRLQCINVEADSDRFQSLQAATADFGAEIISRNIQKTFVEAIPEVLDIVGNSAAFFFLDPFGTKDIPFTQLLPIFRRTARTEVLITLHTDGISKKAGWFGKVDSENVKERDVATKLLGHLAAALDIPIDKLRSGWQDAMSGGGTDEFETRVRAWYVRRLKNSRRTNFDFSKSFKVLYRPDNKQSPVCFHLVFGTQSEKGLFEMNNAMALALEDFYKDLYRDTLFPDYVDEREQQFGRQAARRVVIQQFQHEPFTVDDVRRYCMQETDFVLKVGDYRVVVLGLLKEKKLKRLGSGPVRNDTKFEVL